MAPTAKKTVRVMPAQVSDPDEFLQLFPPLDLVNKVKYSREHRKNR